jgi:hypothetical protein
MSHLTVSNFNTCTSRLPSLSQISAQLTAFAHFQLLQQAVAHPATSPPCSPLAPSAVTSNLVVTLRFLFAYTLVSTLIPFSNDTLSKTTSPYRGPLLAFFMEKTFLHKEMCAYIDICSLCICVSRHVYISTHIHTHTNTFVY